MSMNINLLLGFLGFIYGHTLSGAALIPDNLRILDKEKPIGIFSATFDPLANSHVNTIEAIKDIFQAILVVPADRNPLKNPETSLQQRYQFVNEYYKNDTKVLTPTFSQFAPDIPIFEKKRVGKSIQYLENKGFEVHGIAYIDDLNSQIIGPIKRIVLGIRIPVSHWLILAPTEKSFREFPFTWVFRHRTLLIHPTPASTKSIRNYFKEHPEYFRDDTELDRITEGELPIPLVIKQIIHKQKLYLE